MSKNNRQEWTPDKLRTEAYRLYQLDWMASHGFSAGELAVSVMDFAKDSADPDDRLSSLDAPGLYRDWERDSGFGGSLWACLDEFLGSEFLDRDYMYGLLPAEAYNAWLELWKRDRL